jgi:hypothetical protein
MKKLLVVLAVAILSSTTPQALAHTDTHFGQKCGMYVSQRHPDLTTRFCAGVNVHDVYSYKAGDLRADDCYQDYCDFKDLNAVWVVAVELWRDGVKVETNKWPNWTLMNDQVHSFNGFWYKPCPNESHTYQTKTYFYPRFSDGWYPSTFRTLISDKKVWC